MWSMSLMVSGRHGPGQAFFIILHFAFCIFSDESPAAMQKSGGNGSCLRNSLNFNLVLALAASAVVRWLCWLLGNASFSLVHINYDVRLSIGNGYSRQEQLQPQHQQQSMAS